MNALVKAESDALAMSESELLTVLQSSLYPGAAPASLKMVIGYCKAAGLDPMQKPVHIVPMWDSKPRQTRDVIMPGVNLYRIQASRSGQFAGMSEPEFGPDVKATLGGQPIVYLEVVPRDCAPAAAKRHGCRKSTAREFWTENYAVKGGQEKSIAPNAMWTKRPRGQIAKCASAQALRIAFPEIASAPTADEMEGKPMHADDAPASSAVPQELLDAAEALLPPKASRPTRKPRTGVGKEARLYRAAPCGAQGAAAVAADAARTVDAAEVGEEGAAE